MIIKVKLFGYLREYLKKTLMIIEISHGTNVYDFIKTLILNNNSKLLKKVIIGDYKVSPDIIILINGRNIKHLKDLKTELKDHDTISLLPIAGGGQILSSHKTHPQIFSSDFS
jgi:molybdopterin synthase sulfur carrier subunit